MELEKQEGQTQGIEQEVGAEHNGKATAGLVLGILSIVLSFIPILGIILGIVGIVLGVMGRKSEKKKLATIGIVLSVIGILISLAWFVLSFIVLAFMGI